MSKVCDFIKACECFYVITINDDFPAARPFGAIMEVGDKLYLSTNDENEAHKQLRKNHNMQIIARKTGTREWIRVTGIADECNDAALKQRFLDECPILITHYGSADSEHFLMFQITVKSVEFR